MSVDILKFMHPFTMIVAGSTSSGKTHFVRNLLENNRYLIKINVETPKVLWAFDQEQEIHKEKLFNVDLVYYQGIPCIEDIKSIKPNIIVLDDLMEKLNKDDIIQSLFTKVSHHLNISVIFVTQNLFSRDKSMRTISLNSHYICVMKSVRLTQQISTLGSQIWPGKSQQIVDIYKTATKENFSYLIFDLHPRTIEERFRLRNRIFNFELPRNLRLKYHSVPIYYPLE